MRLHPLFFATQDFNYFEGRYAIPARLKSRIFQSSTSAICILCLHASRKLAGDTLFSEAERRGCIRSANIYVALCFWPCQKNKSIPAAKYTR